MALKFYKSKDKLPLHTIAFYNLENLFDTADDQNILDDDFTPGGRNRWTRKRYRNKLRKLAKTIARIGSNPTEKSPALLGVAEVENKGVLNDLIMTDPLRKENYGIVHYNSPDERGIDTALLYCKKSFKLLNSRPIPLMVNNTNGDRDRTRDILYVHGKLHGRHLHIYVNHWPSRREGEEETRYKRVKAATLIADEMNAIRSKYHDANFVVMGDFNDGPKAHSIQVMKEKGKLYNPMDKLLTPDRGSANYRTEWGLFDQILISNSLLNYERGTLGFLRADIYDRHFLTAWSGRFRGNPFRTFAGPKYLGGFSDHFPVYIQLRYNS
ncbi:MAG: endonuclease [Flavobacteriaceae bacterium]|nr:endonuclease [Flavobacteriaceae bacterium]